MVGIGDDAAVLEPARNGLDIIATDTAAKGPRTIGLTVPVADLSDLAAKGPEPWAALLSPLRSDALPLAEPETLFEASPALAGRTTRTSSEGASRAHTGPLFHPRDRDAPGAAAEGAHQIRRQLRATARCVRPSTSTFCRVTCT